MKRHKGAEVWYTRQLSKYVRQLKGLTNNAINGANLTTPAGLKALMFKLDNLAAAQAVDLSTRLALEFNKQMATQTEVEFTQGIKRALGIDLTGMLANSPAVMAKLEMLTDANINLIQSVRTQYLDRVKTIVTNGAAQGLTGKALAAQVQHAAGVTYKRAKLIARDQTAKYNGALEEAQQTELGIKKYRWSTSGDERVRPSHVANDGKVFSWSKPPETGHPGQDIQCRCVAIPIFE